MRGRGRGRAGRPGTAPAPGRATGKGGGGRGDGRGSAAEARAGGRGWRAIGRPLNGFIRCPRALSARAISLELDPDQPRRRGGGGGGGGPEEEEHELLHARLADRPGDLELEEKKAKSGVIPTSWKAARRGRNCAFRRNLFLERLFFPCCLEDRGRRGSFSLVGNFFSVRALVWLGRVAGTEGAPAAPSWAGGSCRLGGRPLLGFSGRLRARESATD